MRRLTNENITTQVFEVEDEDKYLEVGVINQLEMYDHQMDGCFKNLRSWKAFIQRNFLDGKEYKYELSKSTLKRWCIDESVFAKRFATRFGKDKFLTVDPNDLDFEYSFDFYYNRNIDLGNYPTCVEIYVKATFKK